MDFIFYVIYNSYFKDGNYKNDIPSLTVGGIFTVVVVCFFMLFHDVRCFFMYGANQCRDIERTEGLILAALGGLITYFVFYYNKRYIKIYNYYKDNIFANSLPGKVLGWLSVLLMMMLPFIFIYVRRTFLTI